MRDGAGGAGAAVGGALRRPRGRQGRLEGEPAPPPEQPDPAGIRQLVTTLGELIRHGTQVSSTSTVTEVSWTSQ